MFLYLSKIYQFCSQYCDWFMAFNSEDHGLIVLTWVTHESSSLNLYHDRTTASSVGFLHLNSHLWLQQFCKSGMWLWYKVLIFVTADVSGVWAHGTQQPTLAKNNAKKKKKWNYIDEDVTKLLSRNELCILGIYFLAEWLPSKSTAVRFYP